MSKMEQAAQQTLWFLHWAPDHFQLASVTDDQSLQVETTASFETVHEGINALQAVLAKTGKQKQLHVSVTDAFASLVPNIWKDAARAAYEAAAPVSEHFLIHNIPAWQLAQGYTVPASLQKLLANTFSLVSYQSAPALALSTYNGFSESTQLMLLAGPQYFTVILKNESRLQLCQTYMYTAHLDVLYYLLKIKEQYKLMQEVQLVTGGEAGTDAGLLKTINPYFKNIQRAVPPQKMVGGGAGTAPQFIHLLNLAACVL